MGAARIAAVTMVRDGEKYLKKWTAWYGGLLGKGNLYIFFDGTDQVPPECTDGCNVQVVPRVEGSVAQGDRGRIRLLSDFASGLLDEYDFVIGTDVDEFLAPDPSCGLNLPEYLSALDTKGRKCFSALGVDVVQNTACETALNRDKPFLEQRSFGLLSTRYAKASILGGKAQWGSGFHRVKGCNFHILKDLYLFHFGCVDASDLDLRLADQDLAAHGWGRHLGKRQKLFAMVPGLPVRSWEVWTPRARKIQSNCRPPYAWNKPAMLGLRILVRIPERFSGLL